MSDHLRLSAHLAPPPSTDRAPAQPPPPPTGASEGFRRLDAVEVWTDGDSLIVLGEPHDPDPLGDLDHPDDYPGAHNCDAMGCRMMHVIAHATGAVVADGVPQPTVCEVPDAR